MRSGIFLFSMLTVAAISTGGAELSPLSLKYLNGAWAGNTTLCIPEAKTVPVTDGKLGDSEWDDAVKISGFSVKNRLVPERSGFVAMKRDKKYLYCLVRTSAKNNDPGGGLVTLASGRDSAVYDDDSIEFVFKGVDGGIRHLIFNDNCAIFDRMVKENPKSSNAKWNIQDYQAQSNAESGWWTFEVKLSLAELGAARNGFKFNIARNWSGYGPSALNNTKSHTDMKLAINGVFGNKLPTFQMEDIPAAAAGEWDLQFSSDNPTPRDLMLAVSMRSFSWPKINGKVTRQIKTVFAEEKLIPSGKSASIIKKYTADRNVHYLSVVLYDVKTKRVYYTRLLTAKKEIFTGRRPVTGTFNIPGYGSGLYRHYPGYNKAVFEVTPSSSAGSCEIEFFSDGKRVVPRAVKRSKVAVIELPQKTVTVCCTVKKNGKIIADKKVLAKIPFKKWKWLNNQEGKQRVLLEPFTRIKAVGSDGFSTLRGQYRFAPSGLMENILADGKAILAGKPEMEIVVNGKVIKFDKGMVKTAVAPDGLDAATETVANAGGITVKSRIHSEYDNFNIHNISLFGVAGKKIDRWTIRFPFKKEEAWLFHAVANTIRRNPAGKIPDGSGVVWSGSKVPRANVFGEEIIHPMVVPYIWIGGLERGLSWFFDTSNGMKLDRKKEAVRIVRNGGEVILEIDLINRPAKLKDGHNVEFGTQATPVKPVDLRVVNLTFDALGAGVPSRPNILTISEHILGYPYRWSKQPVNGDWTLFDKLVKLTGEIDKSAAESAVNDYMKKHSAKIRKMFLKANSNPAFANKMEKSRPVWVSLNFKSKKVSIPTKYSDPRLAYTSEPETDYFKSEWFNPAAQNYYGALRTSLTPSWVDFIIYSYAREFDHGMVGCYLDDTFIMPDTNCHTLAKIDEDGELHSATGIFAMREIVKRIATLQHLKGYSPRVLQVHMTNAQIIPAFSFATSQLGWESDFGEKPLQLRYRKDLILAESTGLQIGNAPLSLGGVVRKTTAADKWKPKFDYLTRTLLAMTMPYNVGVKLRASPLDASRKVVLAAQDILGKFGIAEADCKFEPFYDPANAPGEISGKDLMISAYVRKGRKLMIIANECGEERRFVINGNFTVLDAETGKVLAENDRTVKPYDFRLLKLEK